MEMVNKMSVYRVKVYGIELDVYADVTREKDPLGTGDSPVDVQIDINEIELVDAAVDISVLLSDAVVEKIGEQVMEDSRNE
jgi:hypothetical protein